MILSSLPKSIRIVEVGPRDGLQNESKSISTSDKAKFIELLTQSGLTTIEATSFVRPEKIPQMGDAKELYQLLNSSSFFEKVNLPCLVPNQKGLELALGAGVKEIAVFTATSNSFNKKNINATIEESFDRLLPVAKKAKQEGLKIRGYISTVFGCPYEGITSVDTLKETARKLRDMGVYEISLGDTIGIANPRQVVEIIHELKQDFDLSFFSMHFHDTRGTALTNALVSVEEGITSFDGSAGGLGGCPYAKGATGNVATEDLVNLFESMGIKTGVDLEKLSIASTFILEKLGRKSSSKFLSAYLAGKGKS